MFLKIIPLLKNCNIIKMPVTGFGCVGFGDYLHFCILQQFFATALCKTIWKIQYYVLIRFHWEGYCFDALMSKSDVTPWMQSVWLEPHDSGDLLFLQWNLFVSPQTQGFWPQGLQTIEVLRTDTPACPSLTHTPTTDSHHTAPPNKGTICYSKWRGGGSISGWWDIELA